MPRDVTLNALRLTVEEPAAPTRPPVLLVPGMFAGTWYFADWQRALAARGHPAWALELRGHHPSCPVPALGRVSVAEYVEDAIAAARHLGRPVVVGHSMGGLVAQKVAQADAAQALVLVASAPPAGIPAVGAAAALRMTRYLPAMLLSQPLVPRRRDLDAIVFNRTPEAERDAIAAGYVAESGRAARELAFGSAATRVDAPRVRCPVLVLAGGSDRFVPARVARRLARRYGATYREFPGMGHLLVSEPGWETVLAHVADWLEGTRSSAGTPVAAALAAGAGARQP
ncbi:MAG TPA: alpha/beta fold hydrolase [Gemmatimonadaceae bacterium]|nr:alpha/beta fold hydrolase [Gemmatimonadaceae bacterium]